MRVLNVDEPPLAPRPELTGRSDQPAHARIAHWLEDLVVSGELEPGDKLPPEVEIATSLGVSRMTLRQALGAVEAKGFIDRRRGRFGGSFIASPRFELDHASLPGFTEQMLRIDVEPGAEVLTATTRRPDTVIGKALGLRRSDLVHEIRRVRTANGEPIVLEEAYVPAAVFPGLLSENLHGSLYAVMRAHGSAPFTADERIEATQATVEQSEILGVAPASPLLLILRTSFSADGVAVEFSRDYLRSDRTAIRIKSRAEIVPPAGAPGFL
ncbi:UbiC transcription regulator-associated domain-containing protein [Mycolicibacterium aurum]|uniref:UbiC transcription regulator-associated domain-containing protein n=1 Tax=Mycolicibacterium aurum TaxID=1791 RepID=A0A448IN08_MYCAU|nr:GntR family transcriptional regulator [Mycolicibacterium aurum]VEG53800.1 UbiC transcription regulator-associated domain-containing protein [Mycolicibacterium aurum]